MLSSRPPSAPRLPARRCAAAARGFTFIELIVVMGIVGMLMGLTVGFVRSTGRVGALGMAKAQLLDAAYRAQGMSAGDRISLLTVRQTEDENGRPVFEAFTSVASTMMTHAFETIERASLDLPLKVNGAVKREEQGGWSGSCAVFGRGGSVEFEPQSSFAATDGLDVELAIQPESGPPVMTLVEGTGAYDVTLIRGASGGDYDLRLRINARPEDGRGDPLWVSFETEGQPVKLTGRWTHVHVSFDGVAASLRVDNLEHVKRAPGARPGEAPRPAASRRIAVPLSGAVPLLIGSPSQPYVGRMDSVVVRGVFRLAEERTRMPEGIELDVLQPAKQPLPFRVTYRNGRLDPERHPEDVVLRAFDPRRPDDPPLQLRLSRFGSIEAVNSDALPGAAPSAPPAPPVSPPPAPLPVEPK